MISCFLINHMSSLGDPFSACFFFFFVATRYNFIKLEVVRSNDHFLIEEKFLRMAVLHIFRDLPMGWGRGGAHQ